MAVRSTPSSSPGSSPSSSLDNETDDHQTLPPDGGGGGDDDGSSDDDSGDWGVGDDHERWERQRQEVFGTGERRRRPRPRPSPPSRCAGRAAGTNLPPLAASYLAALTTGATTYAFSLYSGALKHALRLSQNQLDTVSSATFCAGLLSWAPGLAVDAYGPRRTMSFGGLLGATSLALYWCVATERGIFAGMSTLHRAWLVPTLSALGVLTFVSCALITGSVFKTIVESSGPGSKGRAVGCAKGYVGLGSGVYACLFAALFGGSGGGGSGSGGGGEGGAARRLVEVLAGGGGAATSDAGGGRDGGGDDDRSSLNFLLMASCLAILASSVPALLWIPGKKRGVPSEPLRDGTTDAHFRTVYLGLMALGAVVVGMSLQEVKEGEENTAAAQARQCEHAGEQKYDGGEDGSSNVPDDEDPGSGADAHEAGSAGVEPAIAPSNVGVETGAEFWLSPLPSPRDRGLAPAPFLSPVPAPFRPHLPSPRLLLSSASVDRRWGVAVAILLLWWGPVISLLGMRPRKHASEDADGEEEESAALELPSEHEYDDNEERRSGERDEEDTFFHEGTSGGRPRGGNDDGEGEPKDKTLTQMLRTVPAWLMLWTCVVLVGGGTVMTNNIGQMTESLGFDPSLAPASLSLFSAAQAASRVVTGSLSESALRWKLFGGGRRMAGSGDGGGVPRPAFLVVASVVSAASHFALAVATTEEGFVVGVVLSGLAFGMVWPLMVLIVGEVFGTLHVGANYMFYDGASSAFGTILLSKFVAQAVYDEHIVDGDPGAAGDGGVGNNEENYTCCGKGCFQMSHLVVSALSLTCIVSSIALMYSTRDVYRRL